MRVAQKPRILGASRCVIRSAFALLVLAGCGDTTVSKFSEPPIVAIESPATGSTIDEGVSIEMSGRVVDKRYTDSLDQERAVWAVDGAKVCEAAVFDTNGLSTCAHIFSAGPATVSLTATNPDGRTANAISELTVNVNHAPSAEITSPVNGTEYYSNSLTDFEGFATDGEDLSELLTVRWESSIDGILPITAPPSGDGKISGSTTLTVGEHRLLLTITDTTGRTGTDSTSIYVVAGSRPDLELLSPVSGDLANYGDKVNFEAHVTDAEDDPADLLFSWTSSIDGEFRTDGASSSGDAGFTYDGLTNGTHTITVTVTDTDGITARDSATLYVNTLPSAPTVLISPDPAGSDDDLAVNITGPSVDGEGDPITYSYLWYQNGVVTTYISNPLPRAATTRGEIWTVEVAPNDGHGDGLVGLDSISIGNGPPSATGVSISPATAYTDDMLTAIVTGWSDPDGDVEGYHYQWFKNGAPIAGATDPTLAGTYFSKGDDVVVEATPWDAADEGAPLASGTRTIQNSVPTTPGVAVIPERPEQDDGLECTIIAASTDADGDAITYTYSWTNNGSATGLATSTVAASYTSDGETWECTVTPADSSGAGTAGVDSVVVNDYTAPDAPILTAIDEYRNETSAVIYGTTEANVDVTLYMVTSTGTSTDTTTASAAGSFTFSEALTRGSSYSVYATATDSAGNTSAVSNTLSTEVCDPYDDYEDSTGYGDSCTNPVIDWATVADDGATTITLTGNILESSDEDWLLVETSDSVGPGINYYRFHVEMTHGTSTYGFAVYEGGCTNAYLDCAAGSSSDPEGSGYSEYEYYAQDVGDGGHTIPGETRYCYDGHGEYNNCDDLSSDYYIHVFRNTSSYSCEYYELEITNGTW